MKRLKSILFTVLLVMCISSPVMASGLSQMLDTKSEFSSVVSDFTDGRNVVDKAGVLSSETAASLSGQAAVVRENGSCGVYTVFISNVEMDDSFGSHSPETAAKNIYTQAGLGVGEEKDGIMLFISVYSRDYYILVKGSYGNSTFTDYALDEIEENVVSCLSDNRWEEAASSFVKDSSKYIEAAASGTPITRTNNPKAKALGLGISILLGALLSGIVTGILRGQMKTVSKQTGARAYVPKNGIQFFIRDDHYTHTTVVRTRRNTDNGGRSGGRSGGSGFSGRGGKF